MYKLIHKESNLRNVKKHKVILTILVILVAFLFILSTDLSPDLYFINFNNVDGDVSCHYAVEDDALKPIDSHFAPASNSIFFHETSCRAGLNSRQACSIESAARAHPDWEIYVIFSATVKKIRFQDVPLILLKKFSNIKFRRVHLVDYAKDTPVESLIAQGALNRTRWPVAHTSDVLRFLTLYKWGGLYLDLDVMVVKRLDVLPKNWAARENDECVASASLALYRDEVGRMVADAALREMSRTFRGDVWGQNGPLLITRVLKEICSTRDPITWSADKCKGFEVFGPDLFNPYADHPEYYFSSSGIVPGDAYMYHIWNGQTHHLKVDSDSFYAKLAERHCPVTYETYGDFFGL